MKTYYRSASIRLVTVATLIACIAGTVQVSAGVLSGKVTDKQDRPIVGVSVILFGNDHLLTGTATDFEGHFELNVSDSLSTDLALRLSSIGYQRRDILMKSLDKNEHLFITLNPALIQIETPLTVPNILSEPIKRPVQSSPR